jgi:hypothetical protein
MDISVCVVELTTMHPRLLWDRYSATHTTSPFPFTPTVQDLQGFGSEQLQFAIDPAGVAADQVRQLQRTYEASRLVELAAIAIAGLGLYYGRGHEMRDVALRGSGAAYLVDETHHLFGIQSHRGE